MLYFHYWRVWNSPKKYYENVLTGKSINNQKLPDRIKKINSDTSDSFGEITTISICFQLIINEYKKAFFFFYVYCLLRTCSISALHIFLSFFDLSNICHITITLKKNCFCHPFMQRRYACYSPFLHVSLSFNRHFHIVYIQNFICLLLIVTIFFKFLLIL